MIFSLMAPVLLSVVGLAIDYSGAERAKASLGSAADSAALAAVSAGAMKATEQQAKKMAQDTFLSSAASSPEISIGKSQPLVEIDQSNGSTVRTAKVTYRARYHTTFARIVGLSNFVIQGSATATSGSKSIANVNFHLLLDNSSSMALPVTQSDIKKMESLTPKQANGNGCAFACHEANSNSVPPGYAPLTVGNPCIDGSSPCTGPMVDNYTLARKNNIMLRIDEVGNAVSALMSNAASGGQTSNQFAVYSLNGEFTTGVTQIMALTPDYLSSWQKASSAFKLYKVYGQGQGCAPAVIGGVTDPCGKGVLTTTDNITYADTGYSDTNLTDALGKMNSLIVPTTGSTAKNVLVLVTDGVEDRIVSGHLTMSALSDAGLGNCAAIKAKGVEIAVLYTSYFPIPGYWPYDNYISKFQSNIAPTLQSCASSGLFIEVAPGSSVTSALNSLFQTATLSARLTQ